MIRWWDVWNSFSSALLQSSGEGGSGYTPPVAPPMPEMAPILLRLAAMMGVVLLVLAGLAVGIWLARRSSSVPEDRRVLRLLQQFWLGRRCCWQLIEADGCRVLVAVDPSGIKFCHLISGEFASLLPGYEPRSSTAPSVEEIMSLLAASRNAA